MLLRFWSVVVKKNRDSRLSFGKLTLLYSKGNINRGRSTICILSTELNNCKTDGIELMEQLRRIFEVGRLSVRLVEAITKLY